jgi:hypothetical protein
VRSWPTEPAPTGSIETRIAQQISKLGTEVSQGSVSSTSAL